MKNLIIAAALFISSAQVFASEQCVRMGQALYSAAAQRDKGISQDEITKNVRRNFAVLSNDYDLTKMVAAAFKHFDVSPDLLQSLAVAKCEDDHAQQSAAPAETPAVKNVSATPAADASPQSSPEKSLLSPTFDVCMDKSNGVTADMLDCIGAETQRQDLALNRNYQAAIKGLPPERKQKLVAAQRAWLAYRKSESEFTANPDGGTSATVNAADEFMQMTAQRAADLAGVATLN